MKISLGCGFWTEPGWIGLDSDMMTAKKARIAGHDVRTHDVRNGLPFADAETRIEPLEY